MKLDDMIDQPGTVAISDAKAALPKGRAKATLTQVSAPAATKGGMWSIITATFLVEGTPYNEEIGRASITPRYKLFIAVDENGDIDTGNKEDGTAKNASLARFFKAFGRSTEGSSFNDLVGSDCEVTLAPEIDSRSEEPTGFVQVTGVYKQR